MGEEYRAKVFKSGNSLALRLPKSLGLNDGEEVVMIPHANGSFSFWKQDQQRDILLSLFGSMSTGFMAEGRGDIDQGDRDWIGSAPAAT
ncbi:antitoxin [Sphingobium scionense]